MDLTSFTKWDAMIFGQLFADETSSQRIFLEYLSKEIRITYFTK